MTADPDIAAVRVGLCDQRDRLAGICRKTGTTDPVPVAHLAECLEQLAALARLEARLEAYEAALKEAAENWCEWGCNTYAADALAGKDAG